ncbi:hypothetical protein AA309_21010 [Microvirga vignae]|uniref:Uncharacterized protein n=1 Tax=Microvirga vignae TaxID=1225564 RepID=A0A0H1R854_9HYPH|nr:hypothetical protein AA309_21010 [Microvirga vignae]
MASKEKLSSVDNVGVQSGVDFALLAVVSFDILAGIARVRFRDVTSDHPQAKLDPCFNVE